MKCCETPWCELPVMHIERCIAPELQALWDRGIETVCSCCGHGADEKAYIRVPDRFAETMEALGYQRLEMHKCLFHEGTTAFQAQHVHEERQKPYKDGRSIEDIRRGRAEEEKLSEEVMANYV